MMEVRRAEAILQCESSYYEKANPPSSYNVYEIIFISLQLPCRSFEHAVEFN